MSSVQRHGAEKAQLSLGQRAAKRSFDVVVASMGLVLTGWVIALGYAVAAWDTGQSGFFRQTRVGRDARSFRIWKLRTMRPVAGVVSAVTTADDQRITRAGRVLRNYKIDELPQLFNVLLGQMSVVGPRPDVPGYADRLEGADRIILSVRPGITGPATLAFRNEEQLLAEQENPEAYNRSVIYPKKVEINRQYVAQYSFIKDIGYILETIKRIIN